MKAEGGMTSAMSVDEAEALGLVILCIGRGMFALWSGALTYENSKLILI